MSHEIKQLEFGTNPNGCAQSVFLALHTKHQVYADSEALPQEYRDLYIPLLFLLNRWDGLVGFPGGNVDPGEDLVTALLREVEEEINVTLQARDLTPIASFEVVGRNRVTHLYAADMGFAFMRFAMSRASEAKDFLTETTGTFLAHMMMNTGGYKGVKGIPALLGLPKPPTGNEQMLALMEHYGWATPYEAAQALSLQS